MIKPETRLQSRSRMRLAAETPELLRQEGCAPLGDIAERTAIHEAGHAVAAVITGHEFDSVTIYHEDSWLPSGVMKRAGRWNPGSFIAELGPTHGLKGTLESCLIDLAGPAAELRYDADAPLIEAAHADCLRADAEARAIEAFKLMPRADVISWAWREACLMMAKPRTWLAVYAVAEGLLENETLPFIQVQKIIQEIGAAGKC